VETWITRIVALICAGGSSALLWFFGVFVLVPWREGRMLSLTMAEFQVIIVSLLTGIAVTWGALHLFGLADRSERPKLYAVIRLLVSVASTAAIISGNFWAQTHLR
jgi:hypothetical protein